MGLTFNNFDLLLSQIILWMLVTTICVCVHFYEVVKYVLLTLFILEIS